MNSPLPTARVALAWAAWERGQHDEARRLATSLIADDEEAVRLSARILQLYLDVERTPLPGTGGRAASLAVRCQEAGDADGAARGFLLAAKHSRGRRRAENLARARSLAFSVGTKLCAAIAHALAEEHGNNPPVLPEPEPEPEAPSAQPTSAKATTPPGANRPPPEAVDPDEAQPRLVAVTLALAQQRDPQGVCDMVARAVHDVLDVDRASVVLARPSGPEVVAQHPDNGKQVSRHILSRCLRTGEEVFVEDVGLDAAAASSSIIGLGVTSVLCVPMIHGAEVVGAIYADAADVAAIALGERKWVLRTLAAAASVAVGNARALTEQEARVRRHRELAHDLCNLLGAAHGAADALHELEPREDQRDLVGIVLRATRAASAQVNEALAPHPPALEPVDLGAIARQAVAMLAFEAAAEDKRFELKLGGEPLWVRGREQELLRAAINLMTNALKYGPRHEPIEVWVARTRRLVAFSVRDRGPGVPEAEREQVFESGRQASNAVRGHGLGLGFVKRVIDECGGRIGLRNEPDGGARALFALPAVDPPQSG